MGDSIAKSLSWVDGYTIWGTFTGTGAFSLRCLSFLGESFGGSGVSTGTGGSVDIDAGVITLTEEEETETDILAAESVVEAGVGGRALKRLFMVSFLAT